MEASAQSSKVTVEYHDPSGVFPLVADDIHTRLPLRNLNWQSPSRPLRQIKSLHLEFVADDATQNTLRPPSARADDHGPNSFDIVNSGVPLHQNAVKERRHQIPGLKKSPYLKIYVLRCDDSESYKDSERKRIRDWVRDTSGKDGRQDNHDAFEWMILHVVIPDTVAASEPRWRDSSSKDSDELKERPKSNSKWPGKSTKTVFDRIRADFNDSGKAGQDHVAQIRLLKSDMSQDLLPTPAIAPTLEESPQERANAWNDLISKFKAFILGPFDLRVRQYESDIAEQESRRSLPGWNFCTFFIHKEGLAKALESIGLVEDALAIYDELSIGLEAVVRDIASRTAVGTATSFALFTDDTRDRIMRSAKLQANGTANGRMTIHDDDASDLFMKDYRSLIVTSNISVFDFLCYIFSRQKTLILRLANARSTRVQFGEPGKEAVEDLVLTSEVCWRASGFIHSSARSLRQDLHNYIASQPAGSTDLDIEGLVCSWSYAVAGQVLQDTTTSMLQEIINPDLQKQATPGSGQRRRLTMTLGVGAEAYPQRSTSLPGRGSFVPELKRPLSRSGSGGMNATRPQSSPGSDIKKQSGFPGQTELATYRADLVLMRRRILQKLAARHQWYTGWASVEFNRSKRRSHLALDDQASKTDSPEEKTANTSETLSPGLKAALKNENVFRTSFEKLTDLAIRHYSAAAQSKAPESLMGDMAILKAQSGEFSAALLYLDQIVPLYATQSWSLMGFETLKMYGVCLKNLQRRDDYVQTMLSLLSRACNRQYERSIRFVTSIADDQEDAPDVSGLLSELIAYSGTLSTEVTVDAENYFKNIQLMERVKLHQDQDGFSLCLSLQHLLSDEIEVEPNARLVSVDDPSLEIWLSAESPTTLRIGANAIELQTPTVACGAFWVSQIVLKAGHVRFEYNLRLKDEALSLTTAETKKDEDAPEFRTPSFIYVYPAKEAFHARVQQASHTRIGKPKVLEISLESGWNDIESIRLKLKPTSAGLRLHLADTTLSGVELATEESAKPGEISLRTLKPQAIARAFVPYTLENSTKEINTRLEILYATKKGSYTLLCSSSVVNSLPLDVDVNDQFHLDVLFSQFSVRTIGRFPLSIVATQLEESDVYSVQSSPFIPLPNTVYNSQPMQLVYQIKQKSQKQVNKQNAALSLRLKYQTFNDVFQERLRSIFAHDLESSAYDSLSRLLIFTLMERSRDMVPHAEAEMAAMLGKVKVPGFNDIGWNDVLNTLHGSAQQDLRAWLQRWHDEHEEIDVNRSFTSEVASRTITIDVDVPNVDIVFGCSLSLIKPSDWMHRGAPIVPLGSPIQATVRVRHTTAWAARQTSQNMSGGFEFVCEIVADADIWLIGGQRRSYFTIRDGGEHTFKVVLIPLQVGTYALPLVDVRLAPTSSDDSHSQRTQPPPVTYENHFESAGQTVRVIRNTRTSRVDIIETSVIPPSPTPGPGPSLEEIG